MFGAIVLLACSLQQDPDLAAVRARDGGELLHRHAYYTVNAIPETR